MPVTREKLYEEVWAEPMTTVAKHYGVSGGLLAGVCERLNVPRPARGHWQQLAVGEAPERPPLPGPVAGQEVDWDLERPLPRRRPSLIRTGAKKTAPVPVPSRSLAKTPERPEQGKVLKNVRLAHDPPGGTNDVRAKPVDTTFDANERIAGFSMLAIKGAITWVGMRDDRDDLAGVARSLECSKQQAARVLEELERRGFVTKAKKRNQWNTTPTGHKLAWYWHPPGKFTAAIEREDEPGVYNEGFASVPCSVWRFTEDEEVVFEEAELDVGTHVDYEGDWLIEISLLQPDEYQGEYGW